MTGKRQTEDNQVKAAKITAKGTTRAAWIGGIFALIVALITAGVIFSPHSTGVSPNNTPGTAPAVAAATQTPTQQFPQLHLSYSGFVLQVAPNGASEQFTMTMMNVQQSNNMFQASGEVAGCNASYTNGQVTTDGRISFTLTPGSPCNPISARYTGSIGMDGSNPRGTWAGVNGYRGQWSLT